jgi:hypothetical protein
MIKNLRPTWAFEVVRLVLCSALLMTVTGAAFGQDLKQASTILSAKISESQRKTVAVVDFTDLCGNVSRFGRYLAEELSGTLVGDAKGFRVMDRTHLQAILQEHKLATTGLIDPQTARKLGQFAGVDTLVTSFVQCLHEIEQGLGMREVCNRMKLVRPGPTEIRIRNILSRGSPSPPADPPKTIY